MQLRNRRRVSGRNGLPWEFVFPTSFFLPCIVFFPTPRCPRSFLFFFSFAHSFVVFLSLPLPAPPFPCVAVLLSSNSSEPLFSAAVFLCVCVCVCVLLSRGRSSLFFPSEIVQHLSALAKSRARFQKGFTAKKGCRRTHRVESKAQ